MWPELIILHGNSVSMPHVAFFTHFLPPWEGLLYYRRVHFVRETIILNIHHLVPGFRPVSQLYFSDITADSLVVAWSAPAPPADNFKLHCSTDDSSEDYEVVLDGSKTRTVISGLLPSREYTVTLVTMHGETASEPVAGTVITGTAASAFKLHPN